MLIQACATTEYETKIEYVHPSIPSALLEPCKDVKASFNTNGELLNSYVELQSAYRECSIKVSSISNILQSYEITFSNE